MPYADIYTGFYGDVLIIGSGLMAEVILFPDVVELTINYLQDEFADQGETATVHSRIPQGRPVPKSKFVTVIRTGGVRHTIVSDDAQVTVESWGATDKEAHDLAQLTRAFLLAMAATVQDVTTIYGVDEFSGPALLPDPLSAHSRYTFTLRIGTRGTALTPLGS